MNPLPADSRRLHIRVLFEQPVRVAFVREHPMGNTLEVPEPRVVLKGHDLSENGLRLDLGPHKPPALIKAVFMLRRDPIEVYARFTWKVRSLCGYEFLFMTEKDRQRVRRFVERRMIPDPYTEKFQPRDHKDDPDPFSAAGRFS